MASKKKYSEERVATASFIITFYQEVQQLKHFAATYNNALVVIENKFKSIDKMPPNEKNDLNDMLNSIRYYARIVFDDYYVMVKNKALTDDKDIEPLHDKITCQFSIERKDLSKYVRLFNLKLSERIMKDMLKSAQDVVDNVFSEDTDSENGDGS